MERERQHQEHDSGGGGNDPAHDPEREARRQRLRGLHEAADRTLDSIQAGDAEQFLEQHRQRGAQ